MHDAKRDNASILKGRKKVLKPIGFNTFGAPSGARTLGTLIKSQVLYQLS